jgi:uncharacterized protein VirK/YbjX
MQRDLSLPGYGPLSYASAPWPSYGLFLKVERSRVTYLRKRIRIAVANYRARKFRPILDATVRKLPYLHRPLDSHPSLFAPLLGRFLHTRPWATKQLVENFSHDLEFTGARIRAAFPDFFSPSLHERLWADPDHDYAIDVAMNLVYPHEGLWRIELYAPGRVLLFSICFSVLPGPVLFIGAVQGGRSADGLAVPDAIRSATKRFEGLRPPFLLLDVVQTLARVWGICDIVGVSNQNQLKGNANSRYADSVRFSYDTFWLESGGAAASDGNWRVPCTPRQHNIADVPSRKRAMYRRRIVMMEGVRDSIANRMSDSRTIKEYNREGLRPIVPHLQPVLVA